MKFGHSRSLDSSFCLLVFAVGILLCCRFFDHPHGGVFAAAQQSGGNGGNSNSNDTTTGAPNVDERLPTPTPSHSITQKTKTKTTTKKLTYTVSVQSSSRSASVTVSHSSSATDSPSLSLSVSMSTSMPLTLTGTITSSTSVSHTKPSVSRLTATPSDSLIPPTPTNVATPTTTVSPTATLSLGRSSTFSESAKSNTYTHSLLITSSFSMAPTFTETETVTETERIRETNIDFSEISSISSRAFSAENATREVKIELTWNEFNVLLPREEFFSCMRFTAPAGTAVSKVVDQLWTPKVLAKYSAKLVLLQFSRVDGLDMERAETANLRLYAKCFRVDILRGPLVKFDALQGKPSSKALPALGVTRNIAKVGASPVAEERMGPTAPPQPKRVGTGSFNKQKEKGERSKRRSSHQFQELEDSSSSEGMDSYVEIPLEFLYSPPPAPGISSDVQEKALIALASVSGPAGILGRMPVTALQVSRYSEMLNAAGCSDPDLGSRPSFIDYPIGVAIGSGEAPYFVGAAVLNPALVLGILFLHFVVTQFRMEHGRLYSWKAGLGFSYFPSFSIGPFFFLVRSSISASLLALERDWGDPLTISCASIGILFWLLAFGYVFYVMYLHFDAVFVEEPSQLDEHDEENEEGKEEEEVDTGESIAAEDGRIETRTRMLVRDTPLEDKTTRLLRRWRIVMEGPGSWQDMPPTNSSSTGSSSARQRATEAVKGQHPERLRNMNEGRQLGEQLLSGESSKKPLKGNNTGQGVARVGSTANNKQQSDEKSSGFCARNGALFDCYKPSRQWFIIAEIFFIFCFGVCGGISHKKYCTGIALAHVFLFTAYSLSMILLRPFRSVFTAVLYMILSVLQAICCAIFAHATMAEVDVQNHPTDPLIAASNIVLGCIYALVVKSCLDLVWLIVSFLRMLQQWIRMQKRLKEKKLEMLLERECEWKVQSPGSAKEKAAASSSSPRDFMKEKTGDIEKKSPETKNLKTRGNETEKVRSSPVKEKPIVVAEGEEKDFVRQVLEALKDRSGTALTQFKKKRKENDDENSEEEGEEEMIEKKDSKKRQFSFSSKGRRGGSEHRALYSKDGRRRSDSYHRRNKKDDEMQASKERSSYGLPSQSPYSAMMYAPSGNVLQLPQQYPPVAVGGANFPAPLFSPESFQFQHHGPQSYYGDNRMMMMMYGPQQQQQKQLLSQQPWPYPLPSQQHNLPGGNPAYPWQGYENAAGTSTYGSAVVGATQSSVEGLNSSGSDGEREEGKKEGRYERYSCVLAARPFERVRLASQRSINVQRQTADEEVDL